MKTDLSTIFFSIFVFIASFLLGVIVHGLIITILSFLVLFFIIKINLYLSIIFSILFVGIINFIFNFRVFMEALVVELGNKEGISKYWGDILKKKRDKEKFRSSVPIEVEVKKYRVIEFMESLFDPRSKNKENIKGFLIFSEENGKKIDDREIQKKVLGVYLFFRHIYFEDILRDVKLKTHSKKIFKSQLKFQEIFKKQIEERIKKGYNEITKLKSNESIKLLKKLDKEVYEQYPFVKSKLDIQIEIFDSLYILFTKPSDRSYNNLIKKIEEISQLSIEENKVWCARLNTWKKLVNYYNLKIENIPNPNFKKVGFLALIDLFKYFISKKEPIITKETLKELFIEGIKVPRKKILKSLNNYFILHKTGIDAIKFNIKTNKKFSDLPYFYKNILKNPPISKIRN